jgi:NAD(P)-dependent dehydrogenase (short-subunit alcohol dehydrogenase family)
MAFAKAGFDVALIARGAERLESARREAAQYGVRALALQADVADADAIMRAADEIARAFGEIDVWVNVAMATVMAPVHRITPEEYLRVTQVTYLGQVHGALAALQHMRPRNSGVIVQVGSALAYRAIPLQSAYCAAKFAVRGFSDSLRSELIHEGSAIKVTMVQLPAVNTPQFDWARSRMPRRLQPVPPIYQPEDVADAIVHAALHAPREYWIGWPAIRAIVGNMVAPGLLDHLAASGAWDQQMTQARANPDRPDNLFDAPPGDPGAHGRFDARAGGGLVSASSATVRAGAFAFAIAALTGLGWLARKQARIKGRSARS